MCREATHPQIRCTSQELTDALALLFFFEEMPVKGKFSAT